MEIQIQKDFKNLDVWVLIAIILIGVVLYFGPLKSTSFCFDDRIAILHDEAIKKIDIPNIFNAFNTRFLVGLSFALNYRWCALNPEGYRFINLLIHCLNAFLVYLLIRFTLYLYSARKLMLFCQSEWVAFLGALLFLCHPIQTEPVNFITQRFVLMGTFFYLLALYLYIQYRCRMQIAYMIASIGAAIAAMFCKEFVITLPLMLALYDFYFLDALAEPWWKRCSRTFPFFVIVLIVPILLLKTPSQAIGVANIADSNILQESNTQKAMNYIDITRAKGSIGRKQYFLTELNVMCTYVRLLFLPINQNVDYDYPISKGIDNKTVFCGSFLLMLLALAAVTYKSYRIVSFCILWFFIALSVESSFIPIGDVITEYRPYLASVGFVFLVMTLIYMGQGWQKKLFTILVTILIGFCILTYQRNKVWKDDFSLWIDTVGKSPHKARPYDNRGMEYFIRGDFKLAISDFNKAIEINPEDANAYYDRGLTYDNQGKFIKAFSDYNKTIELNPNTNASAYENRSVIYSNFGDYNRAISDLNKAIELQPNIAGLYINRAYIYYKQDEFTQALSNLNRAIEIDPDSKGAYISRFEVYNALAHKLENLGVPFN